MEDFIYDEVMFRIDNDLDYLKETCNCKSDFYEIMFLESLNEKDVENIVEKICNDSELTEKIGELVHYYIYHYKRESEVK